MMESTLMEKYLKRNMIELSLMLSRVYYRNIGYGSTFIQVKKFLTS